VDKLSLTEALDWLGVAYIEGGWPGSNPKDEAYFTEVKKLKLKTPRSPPSARPGAPNHPGRRRQPAQAGRRWRRCHHHLRQDLGSARRDALRITLDENLALVKDSVAFLRQATGKPVFYDAEHFFDGYKANPAYALDTLCAAQRRARPG
jgi:2-isopropylmalate synthase